MLHIYLFKSSKKDDKVSGITILARSLRCARTIAKTKFKIWGYKGTPQLLTF